MTVLSSNKSRPFDKQNLLRFLKMIRKDVCWVWTGGKANGYGNFKLDGKTRRAHRLAFQEWIGDIPEGFEIDHLCKNRACVNPAHLELVTHLENMRRGFNASKTHCVRGHELSKENLTPVYEYHVQRQCRECKKINSRLWYEKNKISYNKSARLRYANRVAGLLT